MLAILAIAFAVRVAVIVATPHFQPIYDSLDFDRIATSLVHGHGYHGYVFLAPGPTAYRPPLHPLMLAALYELGGGRTAARLLAAALGVVAVLLVYLIAARLWQRRVALVAASLTAVFPPLVLWNTTLLSESLFVALALGVTLVALEHWRTGALRWAVAGGALCGLAALTRSNGALLVLPLLLAIGLRRPRVRRTALTRSAVVLACTLLVVAPWLVRNTIAFDRFVGISTQGGYIVAGTYNDQSRHAGHPGRQLITQQVSAFRGLYARRDLDEAELSGKLTHRGLRYMRDHPGYVLEAGAWNVLRILDVVHDDPYAYGYQAYVLESLGYGHVVGRWLAIALYAVLALALVGAVAGRRLGAVTRLGPLWLWSIPVLMVLPAIFIWGLARYRAPIDPFILMLAAVGIVAIAGRLRPGGSAARVHGVHAGAQDGA